MNGSDTATTVHSECGKKKNSRWCSYDLLVFFRAARYFYEVVDGKWMMFLAQLSLLVTAESCSAYHMKKIRRKNVLEKSYL